MSDSISETSLTVGDFTYFAQNVLYPAAPAVARKAKPRPITVLSVSFVVSIEVEFRSKVAFTVDDVVESTISSKKHKNTPTMDKIADISCTIFCWTFSFEHFELRNRKPKVKQSNGSSANTVAAFPILNRSIIKTGFNDKMSQ